MSFKLAKCLVTQNFSQNFCPVLYFARFGHRLRGKPPGIARTLEQRLDEENPTDSEIAAKVDIGFPSLRVPRSEELKKRLEFTKAQRKNPELEKLARNHELSIDIDEVKKEWLKTAGPFHIRKLAEHYGVFEHLFGKYAFFTPRVPLDIRYKATDDSFNPVYYGNILKPSQAKEAPLVSFDSNYSVDGSQKKVDNSLWTLVLTNPDGHFTEENAEYVHWMITNIPNDDISKGEVIVPYLQPFPPRGSGFHRHIFVLYKQDKKIDLKQYKIDSDLKDLSKRTFNTLEFYRNLQDVITPAGLAFFQSDWDKTLTDFYHNVLEMKEPIYEYDFPKPYIKDQTYFPLKQPFNLYMDKYRDPKQIHKEYLEKKLANTHPFDGPEKPLQFPNAHPIKGVPSWLKTEIKKNRLRWGRINDI